MFLKFSTCLTIFSDLAKYISLQYVVLPQVLGFLYFHCTFAQIYYIYWFQEKKAQRFFSYSEVPAL